MIPIYKPFLQNYTKSAKEAIDSGWISNHGIFVSLATKELQTLIGTSYCILMNNGTSATHCLFKALKYKNPSLNTIYVPNYTFIAPYNCALMEYPEDKIKVLQTDLTTMNMCVKDEYIKTLEPNSAVIIVHNLGNIVNVPRLQRLRPDLLFVEDNCEGLFGTYEGKFSGTASLCSAVSFYGNKTITTGEGGAFFTNDIDIFKYISTFYSHGMSEIRYIHDYLGTNYRMTNVQAGFLYDQIKDVQTILKRKKEICELYKTLLQPLVQKGNLILLKEEEYTTNSNWMFCCRFQPGISIYSHLERFLLEKQIQIRPFFYSIQTHRHLKEFQTKETNIEGCMLPSFPELTNHEIEYITICVKEFFELKRNPSIEVVKGSVEHIHDFLSYSKEISNHFRYFQKRTPEKAIQNHLLTLLLQENGKNVGYAHLDKEDDVVWLGICVHESKRGLGYGSLLIKELLDFVDRSRIDVELTVDSDNIIAIELYKKKGFKIIKTTETYLRMKRYKKDF